jgi:hypothetical protein
MGCERVGSADSDYKALFPASRKVRREEERKSGEKSAAVLPGREATTK